MLYKRTNGTWIRYFIRLVLAALVAFIANEFGSAMDRRNLPDFLDNIIWLVSLLGGIFVILYMLVTVIELIGDIIKYCSAKKNKEEERLFETAFGDSESGKMKSTNTTVSGNKKQAYKASPKENPTVGMVEGVLSAFDAPIQKGKEYLDKFAAEKNIDFTKKESANTVFSGNTQQKPKQEPKQTNKVFQQGNPTNRQKDLQRESSSVSAVGGLLLVVDAPIQRGKLYLDKFVIEKNIVMIPVNGKSMQIDISCKKFKTMPDIELGNFERHDIKKGTLIYVLVAVIECCINIWGKEWDENTETSCNKISGLLNQKLNPYGVKTRISEKGWHFLENGRLITLEDVIYLVSSKTA